MNKKIILIVILVLLGVVVWWFTQSKKVSVSNVPQPSAELLATLPPDPGGAGETTLAGIDSNGNGVRDDIERYIVFAYPESEKTRAGLMQMARAAQNTILQAEDKNASIKNTEDFTNGQQCLEYFIFYRTVFTIKDDLKNEILNTRARIKEWSTAQDQAAGEVRTVAGQPSERKAKCSFNPDSMAN